MISIKVVFPTPGGPEKIVLPTLSFNIALRNIEYLKEYFAVHRILQYTLASVYLLMVTALRQADDHHQINYQISYHRFLIEIK